LFNEIGTRAGFSNQRFLCKFNNHSFRAGGHETGIRFDQSHTFPWNWYRHFFDNGFTVSQVLEELFHLQDSIFDNLGRDTLFEVDPRFTIPFKMSIP
jgi:hypothetical protein